MTGAASPSAGYLAGTSSDLENGLLPMHTDSLTQASPCPCYIAVFCAGLYKIC